MKKMIGVLSVAMLAASAQAETLDLKCQRYESKCSASACYHLSEALKDDKDRQIFAIQKTEEVDYHIEDASATATLENEVPNATLTEGKYILPYKHVSWKDGIVVLENRTSSGMTKEKIEIDRDFGFYSHYMMHTDSSIADVPLGEPYTAYFGWCEDTSVKQPEGKEWPSVSKEQAPETSEKPKAAPAPKP